MELTPEQLELSFLSSLRTPEVVRQASAMGVDQASFQVAAHALAWEYIETRAARDEACTPADVAAAVGVELIQDVTDLDTFAEELLDRASARKARLAMQQHIGKLESDPIGTIRSLATSLNEITAKGEIAHSKSYDSDAERLQAIIERTMQVDRGEIVGIPTGLPVWDDAHQTFKKGDLIAVIAATNGGKSFTLLHFGATAWLHGKKVLFLSPESTIEDIHSRLDPIIARRKYNLILSNQAIRDGTMTPDQLEVYKRYYGNLIMEGRSDWVTRDSGDKGIFSLDDVVSHTRQFKPDMVLLDGFHLIRSPGSKSWETIKSAAETLKGLAQDLGIVIIAASQARRDAVIANDDTPELGDTAYGMALVEAANKVIGLAAMRNSPQMRVFKVPKNRDGPIITKKQFLHFDVDSGDIRQYRPEVDRDTGEVSFL